MAASANPLIEATKVGSALCLYRRDTGALGLLNSAALSAFESEGGHWGGAAWFSQPTRLATPNSRPDFPLGAPALEADLRLVTGPVVRLSCHDPLLGERLSQVLSPLGVAAVAEPTTSVVVASNSDRTAFAIWRDGAIQADSIPPAEIRRRVLVQIARSGYGAVEIATILHASAVTMDHAAVLLVGRSGAGKSTLTAALVAAGSGYLADDLTPLTSDGRSVLPFPTALSVKAGAWSEVARAFAVLRTIEARAVGSISVRYLPMPPSGASGPLRVETIVFPSFEPGSTTTLRQLSPEEAFALLVDAGSEIVGANPSARPLVKLAETASLVHLTYGKTRSAIAALTHGRRP